MAQKIEAVPMRGYAEASPEQANPWLIAQRQFDIAADKLGLDTNMRRVMRECKRELIVTFPVLMDEHNVQMFTDSRIHHNVELGHGTGGIRNQLGTSRE